METVVAQRYELGVPLGSGGMARVVEGYDRALGRRVAVKLLRDELAADANARRRFLSEARTAASFDHPNAVTIYDTGEQDNIPFIVMELVEGPSLAEVLETEGRFEEREALRAMDQVLAALAAAHQRGFVHRDVKPSNILLDPDGRAKLADFGIAKSLQEASSNLTATGVVIGTPRYLAPEQVAGEEITPRTDVYSAGIVLYELLSGRTPFEGDNPLSVAWAHQRDPVPRLDRLRPGLEPGLVATVHRALSKDPAQRHADAGALRAALRVTAPPPSSRTAVLPVAQPTAHRMPPGYAAEGNPARMALIIGALALLGILGYGITNAVADRLQAPPPPPPPPPASEQPGADLPGLPSLPDVPPGVNDLLDGVLPGAGGGAGRGDSGGGGSESNQELLNQLRDLARERGDQAREQATAEAQRIAEELRRRAESGELRSEVARRAEDALQSVLERAGGGG